MPIERYIVTVKRPSNCSLSDLKPYIFNAVDNWSGGYDADDPRSGIRCVNAQRIHGGDK